MGERATSKSRAEETGDYLSEEYIKAEAEFMLRYSAEKITESSPECLKRPKKFGTESYVTAWGQNEFSPSGTLKNFEFSDKISDIKEPCLITSGLLDLCSPLIAKAMYDKIPNSKWDEKYIKILIEWLDKND